MYLRLVEAKAKPEHLKQLQQIYEEKAIPALEQIEGCLYAALIQSARDPDSLISLTLWDAFESADTYEKSGRFKELFGMITPYLSESSEWKVQLSKDLKLEYAPVPEEPSISAFPVVVHSDREPLNASRGKPMHTRIVSLKIRPGMKEEFERIYTEEILPVLRSVKGCRYVFLTQTGKEANEMLSLTIWDSKEDAETYEKSGLFDQLKDKAKHTFSELYQWKMKLEKEPGEKVTTSDDARVNHYTIIAGKKFKE